MPGLGDLEAVGRVRTRSTQSVVPSTFARARLEDTGDGTRQLDGHGSRLGGRLAGDAWLDGGPLGFRRSLDVW